MAKAAPSSEAHDELILHAEGLGAREMRSQSRSVRNSLDAMAASVFFAIVMVIAASALRDWTPTAAPATASPLELLRR